MQATAPWECFTSTQPARPPARPASRPTHSPSSATVRSRCSDTIPLTVVCCACAGVCGPSNGVGLVLQDGACQSTCNGGASPNMFGVCPGQSCPKHFLLICFLADSSSDSVPARVLVPAIVLPVVAVVAFICLAFVCYQKRKYAHFCVYQFVDLSVSLVWSLVCRDSQRRAAHHDTDHTDHIPGTLCSHFCVFFCMANCCADGETSVTVDTEISLAQLSISRPQVSCCVVSMCSLFDVCCSLRSLLVSSLSRLRKSKRRLQSKALCPPHFNRPRAREQARAIQQASHSQQQQHWQQQQRAAQPATRKLKHYLANAISRKAVTRNARRSKRRSSKS